MTNDDFTLLTRSEYFQNLTHMVAQTKHGDRVAATAMILDATEPVIAEIMDELCAAAQRGVHVHLAIDARIFLIYERSRLPGPLWFRTTLPRYLPEPFRTHRAKLEALATAGGHYTIINWPKRPFTLPHAGSSHIKAAVINDTVFVGGCNLEKPHDVDMMLRWHDSAMADWLYKMLTDLTKSGHAREALHDTDVRHIIDAKTDILVDAGKPEQSIILEEAFKLIDSADKWILLTCQYVPHGLLADHIVRAKRRGLQVTVWFNHPGKHPSYEALLQRGANIHERLRLPKTYFQGQLQKQLPFLHGKLIATDKGVMIGSHNYVTTGVRLGTAEMALYRRDEAFAQQLADFIRQQLADN